MSVSGSLTKQSVAWNMRVILVETVICSICREGGRENVGGWGGCAGCVVLKHIGYTHQQGHQMVDLACFEAEA